MKWSPDPAFRRNSKIPWKGDYKPPAEPVVMTFFRKNANQEDISRFYLLKEQVERAIERDSSDFDMIMEDMDGCISGILWRMEDIVVLNFNNRIAHPGNYCNQALFNQYKAEGQQALLQKDINGVRRAIIQLDQIRVQHDNQSEKMFDDVSVVRR